MSVTIYRLIVKIFCNLSPADRQQARSQVIYRSVGNTRHETYTAPVAQLDRVVGSDPIGRGFKSLRARQTHIPVFLIMFLHPCKFAVLLLCRLFYCRGHKAFRYRPKSAIH